MPNMMQTLEKVAVETTDIAYSLLLSQEESINILSLPELESSCLQEMNRYWRGDKVSGRYGLALFYRAMVTYDAQAWEALQHCFVGLVRSWFYRHAKWELALALDTEENYIAQAFTRLWYASRKNPNLQFTTLGAALDYLRASLNAVIIDTLRIYARPKEMPLPDPGSPGEPVVENIEESSELWKIICSIITNEREKRVAYLYFFCGLKVREILQFCPQEFRDAQELYALRRNLFKRLLRNADQIRWRLGESDE
jgi:hypothetical protein